MTAPLMQALYLGQHTKRINIATAVIVLPIWDPLRLAEEVAVLDNLIDNAVSFSPDGGLVRIIATVADDQVLVSVEDEGPGVPEPEREHIFRRFHSVRPEGEAFGKHSGLGLAIARTIAEAHDGTLLATSRRDGQSGACLELGLPKKR